MKLLKKLGMLMKPNTLGVDLATDKILKVILLIGFIALIVGHSFFNEINSISQWWKDFGIYYKTYALYSVTTTGVLAFLSKGRGWLSFICRIIFYAAIGNLYDEFFGNPHKIELNEYLEFLAMVAIEIILFYIKAIKEFFKATFKM